MKRKIIVLLMATVVASALTLAGCAKETPQQKPKTVSVSKTEEKTEQKKIEVTELAEEYAEASEEQKKVIEEVLPEIVDRLVLEEAKSVNLAASLKDDSNLIKKIEVLNTDVDTMQAGTYDVTYKVSLDSNELQKKLTEEKEHSVELDDQKEPTVTVILKETVTVVTEETAKKLTAEGREVITDNGTVYKPESSVQNKEDKNKDAEKSSVKPDTKTAAEDNTDKKKEDTKAPAGTGTFDNTPAEKEPDKKTEDKQPSSPSSPKPSTTPSAPKEPSKQETHTHSWTAQKKTVHHDAEYQMEYVIDQAAWDEDIYIDQPVYTTTAAVRCGCGAVFPTYAEWCDHEEYYADTLGDFSHGSYGEVYHQVQTGTEKVYVRTDHHAEKGHFENKLIKAAYDEEVVTGYKCSSCGATK